MIHVHNQRNCDVNTALHYKTNYAQLSYEYNDYNYLSSVIIFVLCCSILTLVILILFKLKQCVLLL